MYVTIMSMMILKMEVIVQYTISSFAKMQGLTVDTVRQYEKKKIINPYKDKANNYRYYSNYDVRKVSTCKFYSSLGFSLSQASKMVSDISSHELSSLFDKQAYDIEQKLKFEYAKLNMINKYKEYFSFIPDKINNYVLIKLPELIRLPHSENDQLSLDKSITDELKRWVDLLPVTYYTRCVSDKILLNDSELFKFEMSLTTERQSANEFGLKLSRRTISINPSDYIFTVIIKPDIEPIGHVHFKDVMEYFRKNKLSLSGDSFLIYLASDIISGEKYNYHGVFLPFTNK